MGTMSGLVIILTENFHMMMGIGTAGSGDEEREEKGKKRRNGRRRERKEEAEKFQVWR
jgi:hypothetical protein